MTLKQIERIPIKIAKIKKALATDKKSWGGFYDDSRGLRYLVPELYLKIQDYSGAQRYFKWFNKNFPEDLGYPVFLFEWAIALFKKGKIKAAKSKIIETDITNMWIIPTFLQVENSRQSSKTFSSWDTMDVAEGMGYSTTEAELSDFGEWLSDFVSSAEFSGVRGFIL